MSFFVPRDREQPEARPDWSACFGAWAGQVKRPELQRFYAAGTVAPDCPLSEVPFVALDVETTGLNADRHAILSVGLVPFTLKRITVAGSRHWVVKPRLPLLQQSIQFHGITHTDIKNAPDMAEVLPDLLDSLAGRIVVVHHRAIERSFMDVVVKARWDEGLQFPIVDTMAIEAMLHRDKPQSLWARLTNRRRESIRLSDSRIRYGLPHYPPHNALTDALATAELFQAQCAYHFEPSTPISNLWY
ncbi:3'-5' exonuclease [Saccharospirillum impatiens]|uniref:3'-5' exonuclease n=1 Tax=Saccharospirillum impatiens TaxID=169438 RepID=UPI000425F0BF|nr:3'-5' exonuclease [Saccharospirillum impatiens]